MLQQFGREGRALWRDGSKPGDADHSHVTSSTSALSG